MKNVGIDGLMYNGGHKPETYARVRKIVKDAGLEFYAWIPAMVSPLDIIENLIFFETAGTLPPLLPLPQGKKASVVKEDAEKDI